MKRWITFGFMFFFRMQSSQQHASNFNNENSKAILITMSRATAFWVTIRNNCRGLMDNTSQSVELVKMSNG